MCWMVCIGRYPIGIKAYILDFMVMGRVYFLVDFQI